MEEVRSQFKATDLDGTSLIYPVPVIKNNKYLIEVDPKFKTFFINVLKYQYLVSPDIDKSYLIQFKTHRDGKTDIYHLNFDKLHFKFLKDRELDLKKAHVIEQLLSRKVVNCLQKDEGAYKDLMIAFEKQISCSTCQKLGIGNPLLKEILGYLKVE